MIEDLYSSYKISRARFLYIFADKLDFLTQQVALFWRYTLTLFKFYNFIGYQRYIVWIIGPSQSISFFSGVESFQVNHTKVIGL